jgi:electron transfer flavoprotein alpha subunit
MYIKVKSELCTGCEACVASCPYDAIVIKGAKAEITELCQLCRACMSVCPEGAISEYREASDEKETAQGRGVWVFAEQREGRIAGVSLELLGAGRGLAEKLGTEVSAVLFGGTDHDAKELVRWGADKVFHCDDPGFQAFNDEPYAALLSKLITEQKPEIVLTGATPIGRSFFPRVAAKLRAGLTADCTSLEIDSETKNLLQVRRPRVMKRGTYDEARIGEIIKVSAKGIASRTKVVETVKEVSELAINLQDANIIVAGGRGMGNEKGFQLLHDLAEVLGASVAASRGAVDEGWIPYRHQIGQTGKTVSPKLYIACGISGAVQHLVGMQSSDVIIAINKNPDAPIFNVATYGIVGDANEILPMLTKKIKDLKG